MSPDHQFGVYLLIGVIVVIAVFGFTSLWARSFLVRNTDPQRLPDHHMKATLRTWHAPDDVSTLKLVEISDDHDFAQGSYADTIPFAVGSNQEIIEYDPDDYFEIIGHGVCHSQYFQGCGVSGTHFDNVATGVGDSPGEAIDDALETMAQDDIDRPIIELVEASDEYKKCKASEESVAADQRKELGLSDDEDLPDCNEVYWYISIRFNTNI